MPPEGSEIAQQVPRSDNSAADAAANRALDSGTFMELRTQELEAFVYHLGTQPVSHVGFVFSFDGASRGNPGSSASGV